MTYYPDLSESTMVDVGPHVRAIGWLDVAVPFPIGTSTTGFVTKLRELVARCAESSSALNWGTFSGWHHCQFCGGKPPENCDAVSLSNLGVPADKVLYVAPEMVAHYVYTHRYQPPAEFVAAVLNCPLPGTKEYDFAVEFFRNINIERQREMRIYRAAEEAVNNGATVAAIQKAAACIPRWDDTTLQAIKRKIDEIRLADWRDKDGSS